MRNLQTHVREILTNEITKEIDIGGVRITGEIPADAIVFWSSLVAAPCGHFAWRVVFGFVPTRQAKVNEEVSHWPLGPRELRFFMVTFMVTGAAAITIQRRGVHHDVHTRGITNRIHSEVRSEE